MNKALPTAAVGLPLSALPPRVTLRDQAVDQLRNLILGGHLAPGDALRETEIAERLGVSRGPLREALRQLIEEGLVEHVPFSGSFVKRLTERDVRELYSVRTTLESFAFQLAWDRRDDVFRQEMEDRHQALIRAIDGEDKQACIEAEIHLHGLVYEWARHRMLAEFWSTISNHLHFYFIVHQSANQRIGADATAHVRYVELAVGDDLPAMLAEIEDHMKRGIQPLLQMLGGQAA